MDRMPSQQALTWFLDLYNQELLDLEPDYQRKSVWTNKDRKYFLDTIFNNYPCPAIFIHRETNNAGVTTYHVVDGKQRLQTIIDFSENKISLPDMSNEKLNNKLFGDLNIEDKRKFWDYVLISETINVQNREIVTQVFDRLNRNHANLNRQELRHAKYDGWFIHECENETEHDFWDIFKVRTNARRNRMKDVQFVSELLMIIIEKNISSFNQDHIDQIYSNFNNQEDIEKYDTYEFNEEDYLNTKNNIKKIINQMIAYDDTIKLHLSTVNNMYSLWFCVEQSQSNIDSWDNVSRKYLNFMNKIKSIKSTDDATNDDIGPNHKLYYDNSYGASTDFKQRNNRSIALMNEVFNNEDK